MLLINEKLLNKTFGLVVWLICGVAVALVVGYQIVRAIKTVKKLASYRLCLACEMSVGQELEQVIRPANHPYRIFHDIQFEGFNVDHLIVTPEDEGDLSQRERTKGEWSRFEKLVGAKR
ncbi:hypothetical protein DN062_16040 [Nitrincola tibetensis]|uniref:Uncharacterized protein n=1 Tax=Nitrincola tibetensis TaxID=2219697 RepID=A0A364NIL9_9GAMM|nr:NERD domain-containing protein [Nitrincola tibetensis]RAU16903.1 hypothetical protein DN062_16040 [Nitrincola tibetensis]